MLTEKWCDISHWHHSTLAKEKELCKDYNYHRLCKRIVLKRWENTFCYQLSGMGTMVLGHNPPGHVPPGHLPQGHIPLGHLPPGHLPPGHLPPRTYTPWDIYPLDTYPQDTYPLGHIPPGQIPPEHIRLAQTFETERKKLLFTLLYN